MPNQEAVLAAIEQAKAALDQIEAEMAKQQPEEPPEAEEPEGEDKPPMPMMPGKRMPPGM